MAYRALDNDTVIDYLLNQSSISDLFKTDQNLTAREIGDGNLNQVFVVDDGLGNSVIVKQALPYLRVAGDSWPLTLERIHFETKALKLQNELAPGLVPQVYDYDEEMALVVMENLNRHELMRKPLVKRIRFPLFADHISTYLARTLFFTSDLYLSGPQKKSLQAQFINPDLCKIQEDFVFTHPFMDSPENQWNPLLDDEIAKVRSNGDLKISIAAMKAKYMTEGQAIIHSDLHTGSIMLNEFDTRVIDPEFGFCGPMGFDIGALIENIILNYLSHFSHTPQEYERLSYQEYLLDLVRKIWNLFAEKFEKLWLENPKGDLMTKGYWDYPGGSEDFARYQKWYINNLLRDTAGFGGCKMLRRMMGIVSVWDITIIKDTAKRAVCEKMAIRIGTRWILERDRFNCIEDLISIVREESGA